MFPPSPPCFNVDFAFFPPQAHQKQHWIKGEGKIVSSKTILHTIVDLLEHIMNILELNYYPLKLIDKIVLGYLNKKLCKDDIDNNEDTNEEHLRYFKLPFIGKFSNTAKLKIKKLATKYCKKVSVKVNFYIM